MTVQVFPAQNMKFDQTADYDGNLYIWSSKMRHYSVTHMHIQELCTHRSTSAFKVLSAREACHKGLVEIINIFSDVDIYLNVANVCKITHHDSNLYSK